MKQAIEKYKKLNIKRLTLVFNDEEVEQKYNQEYYDKSITGFRISFFLLAAIYALFGILDLYVSELYIAEFAIIRYYIVAPLVCILLTFSYFSFFKKVWQILTSITFVIGGWGIVYMLIRFPENIYYYGGLFLVFAAGYFFIKLHFRWAVFSGVLILLFFNLAPIFSNSNNELTVEFFIASNAFYIAVNIISGAALYNNKRTERMEFMQRLLLREQQEKIRHYNDTLEEKIKERTQLLEDKNVKLNEEIENRKRVEEVLIIAKQKAEEGDRLKTAFLSNMSHEIRTPMNGIIGFLDFLSTPDLSEAEQKQYLDIVKQSSNRLLETINDIIEISKIEAREVLIHTNNVDLKQTFQYLADFFAPETKAKGIELIMPELKDEFVVQTDENKLESILTNLLKNAIKFTNEGSIELGFMDQGEYLHFFVKDTGIGIPNDKFTSIFDRFVQADLKNSRDHEGAGLGLSICKAYIENMGGEIWLESEEQKGTTFYFTLAYTPVHDKPSANKLIDKSKAQKARKIKALVAEDDEVSFKLICAFLENEWVEVIRANNGKEAVEYFEQQHETISIIFMDIKMPVLDGIEATKIIRKRDKNIPIIAQTAFALSGDKELAIQAGCNEYLSKPLKHDELISILNQSLKI